MHELSIAHSLVEIATEHVRAAGADSVRSLTLKLGALSCVHKSALEFSFELVAKNTPLEGAVLHFIDVPVVVYCPQCACEVELPGIQRFRCPQCDTPTAEIRSGRELDLQSLEIVQSDAAPA
ncbi:MAG: hydrogenase maturation nickel metallochaperone HypA [Planctomycetaceae bacterium]|nr:hydrogenase maturation nickel metallochaperone HypA [Planctomycetaceae bacterium]